MTPSLNQQAFLLSELHKYGLDRNWKEDEVWEEIKKLSLPEYKRCLALLYNNKYEDLKITLHI